MNRIFAITDEDKAMMEFVAKGLDNLEISERMHISIHTVKARLKKLFAKTNTTNRVQLAVWWVNYLRK